MRSIYRTSHKDYLLRTDKFTCNKFGLAEFFSDHYRQFAPLHKLKVLDVGSGAFPLGIFLADQFECNVTGVELNPIACACADTNIAELGLSQSVRVVRCNFTEYMLQHDGEKFDLITANPPVDEKTNERVIQRYSEYTFEKLDDESFSFLTNSWRSKDGKDLVDYIFEYGSRHLNKDGRVLLVFCLIDCDSPRFVYEKASNNGFLLSKVKGGYVSSKSIGAESLNIEKVYTIMAEFRRA